MNRSRFSSTSTQQKLEFLTRVGTITHQYKALKQAGVVHDIKSQLNNKKCYIYPYCAFPCAQ